MRLSGVIVVSLLLSACVTTGPTGKLSEPDLEEASRLNLDLGISYVREGKFEEALAKLQKSIEADPENSAAYRVMAFAYEQVGDVPRAEANYRKAARYGEENQETLNAVAVFLCRNDKEREALRYFDKALDVPQYQYRHEIFTNAGTCAKEFDLAAAEGYLRRALGARPDYPEALFQMADVSYRQGNYLQARAFIERRLSAADPRPETLWLASRIETALGDDIAADDYRQRLQKDFPGSPQALQLAGNESGRG